MAATPDAIASAFIATLSPGGVPVGGIGAFTKRTPDASYQGPTPIVLLRPAQNVHGRAMAAGGLTLGKIDQGYVEVVYRDATLEQQKVATPSITLSQIEDAAVAARNAIVATLDANNTLGGAVTIAAESIEETTNPEGLFAEWQGAEWLGFSMRISYIGTLDS